MLVYVFKILKRSIVTNMLFCLLLILAGVLLCISAGLWYSAHKALINIDETITTIAVPDRIAITRFASDIIDSRNISEFEDDVFARANAILEEEEEIFRTIREDLYTSGLIEMDTRRTFNAIADGVLPIPLRTTGFGPEVSLARHSGQSFAAFVVTCEMLLTNYYLQNPASWGPGYESEPPFVSKSTTARFIIDEVVYLHESQLSPRYVEISFYETSDGSAPFERGKQYIVVGSYVRSSGIGRMSMTLLNLNEAGDNFSHDYLSVGQVHSNEELNDLISSMWPETIAREFFPIDIMAYTVENNDSDDDAWYSFIEMKGSIEETLGTFRGQLIKQMADGAEISADSFQIITTNNPNSFPRFNQNRALFYDGRTFTRREIETGARVCLVSRQFAEFNDLSVGDTLPLEMYASVWSAETFSYLEAEGGNYITQSFWIPSLYHSDLEISSPEEFTIVGIYNNFRFDRSEYAITPNFVFIPDNSFDDVQGEAKPIIRFDTSSHSPVLTDGMIIQNGTINETKAAINNFREGYGGLFRFYDQGYESLIRTLGNLRFGLTWILVMSAAGWAAVLLIFLMFYVTRKRKETALLYAIGVKKTGRLGWVYAQCAVLILFSLGISIAISLPLYEDILNIAAGTAQEFTDSFRDLTLSDAADSGLRQTIPIEASQLALIVTIAGASLITLIAAGLLSVRNATFKSLSEKGGDE